MKFIPTWLVDVWIAYKDVIVPVLITLSTAIVTAIALKIKTDAKVNSAKADLQIEAMKKIADKEDYSTEIEQLTKETKELKNTVTVLTEMVDLAFENSSLDSDIKSNLGSLKNKAVYGVADDRVKSLEAELAKTREELAAANEAKQIKVVESTTTQVPVRRRR